MRLLGYQHYLRISVFLSFLQPLSIVIKKVVLVVAINSVLHERTKHVELDYHNVRDQLKAGNIFTSHVYSQNQVADIFTKRLPFTLHNTHMNKFTASFTPLSLKGD